MCVIVVKMKGSDFPSTSIIRACADTNPNGFSMMWGSNGDKTVHNFKTMDKEEAVAKYEELASTLDPATTGFVFHARISTHGSNKIGNCHCWVETVENGSNSYQLGFAHNGVLHNIPTRDDMTDSETFFQDYFLPVCRNSGWKAAKIVAQAIIGQGSRFAFMCNSGNIELLGDFKKYDEPDKKGKCYYSNLSWLPVGTLFAKSSHPSRPSFYGSEYMRIFDDVATPTTGFYGSRKSNFKKNSK